MSYIPLDACLRLLGMQNGTSIYELQSTGLINRYYIASGEGTRHLMASPEVVGYESYLAMKPATTARPTSSVGSSFLTAASVAIISSLS